MKFETLYGKDSKGKIRVWEISVDGNVVSVTHGLEEGKKTTKTYEAKGKNKGKSNETTDHEQAVLEAQAKHTIQQKNGYFLTKEEACEYVDVNPMKCQDYKDFEHKVKYPCLISYKLNGFRILIDKEGNCLSKQGETYTLPKHLECLKDIAKEFGGLDGEIYAGLPSEGGLSLQEIISAFRKPNANTEKLKMFIYDIPRPDMSAENRQIILKSINYFLMDKKHLPVVVLESHPMQDKEACDVFYNRTVASGYEGVVYRNMDGLYEYGKRSYDMIKRKPRQTAEALVCSVVKDKNGQGVLSCQALNGEQEGKYFDLLMRKDADKEINYRLFENACKLLEKTVEYEYEELSLDGVPQKPCGVRLREVLNGESRY